MENFDFSYFSNRASFMGNPEDKSIETIKKKIDKWMCKIDYITGKLSSIFSSMFSSGITAAYGMALAQLNNENMEVKRMIGSVTSV